MDLSFKTYFKVLYLILSKLYGGLFYLVCNGIHCTQGGLSVHYEIIYLAIGIRYAQQKPTPSVLYQPC
jgi:hypothetical protein